MSAVPPFGFEFTPERLAIIERVEREGRIWQPEEFVNCRHCGGAWRADELEGFARHEGRCALRLRCPHCGAAPGVRCFHPGGQSMNWGAHSKRERAARDSAHPLSPTTEDAK